MRQLRISEVGYGFVYMWYDRKYKRYYVGCHWGNVNDGYICSSTWMIKAYKIRPEDFKRRILKTNLTREQMYEEEQRYFDMIKPNEIKIRYYNLCLTANKPWHVFPDTVKTVGEKISASKLGKSNGKHSKETIEKISQTKLANNIKFTDEHKVKRTDFGIEK